MRPHLPRSDAEKLHRKLHRRMLQTIRTYGLIEEGDRIMVAVSGGKDSYTLLDMLERSRRRSPMKFELIAVHLDQQQPGYDGAPLRTWLEGCTVPFEIVSRDTYSVVMGLTKPGDTFCAPCSRLRRGILYDTAERLGCTKIALGHHRDDAIETLLMNLFYAGRLQAMPATYRTNCDRFDVIRPLIECAEDQIAAYATALKFPILPCNLCGSQDGLKRVATKRLIDQIAVDIPNVREVMLGALKHVRPSHLLDPEVAGAWAAAGGGGATEPAIDPCGGDPTSTEPGLVLIQG